jgi:hypothetical protein
LVERNHVSGDGWLLVLNDGWQSEQLGNGNYTITKQ